MKNKFILPVVFLSALFLFAGCKKEAEDIHIIYTNDVHGYIDNLKKNSDIKDNIPGVRYSSLTEYVKQLKSENKNVLLVDAGDHIQGTIYCAIDNGETIVNMMNTAGYDLATPGNHEFDYGMKQFLKLAGKASYPYISCNFYKKENGKITRPLKPSKIFKIGNSKIAFIGITTPETITSSTPKFFQNENGDFIYFIEGTENPQDLYDSVQKAINDVQNKAKYVIALGHVGIGLQEQKAGISSIDIIKNTTGLDCFIDGHSHSLVSGEIIRDKNGREVVLTQTGYYMNSFGEMIISEYGITNRIFSYDERYDGEIEELENAVFEKVKNELGKKLAVLETELYISNPNKPKQRLIRSTEMNSGDFVADSTYWYFNEEKDINCDLAIANGGGIRASIKSGDITKLDVKNVQPFGNMICLIKATGQQIKDALEMGLTVIGEYDYQWDSPAENGGFLHVAGLKYSVDSTVPSRVKTDSDGMFEKVDGKYRVHDIEVYNRVTGEYEKLDLNKEYTVGGINYILRNSGNGCSMFKNCDQVVDFVGQDCDIMSKYIESFAKEGKFPLIKTANSPLSTYKGYLIDYENPYGSGRILIK